MNNPFVKTVATKKIIDAINTDGPDSCYMSFTEYNKGSSYELVIGAKYEHRCAARFSKEGIKELIDILQEIHDTL